MPNIIERSVISVQRLIARKAFATLLPAWQEGQAAYPDGNFLNNANQGYKKNELVFACIGLKADSAASPRLIVRNKRSKRIMDEHPLRKLIQQPNPFMTEFDFHSINLIYSDLAGRSYWEKVRSKTTGKVVQMWPLRPDWMTPIKTNNFIGGYSFGPPGLKPVFIPASDVLDFKTFDPTDLYKGLAPVSVAMRTTTVDNATTDFIKMFFQSGGMPPGLLTSRQKLLDSQVEDIRRRWSERYGGWQNWMAPAVLDSDAQFQRIGFTFAEMGFEKLDARSEIRICMTLRVPPILVHAGAGLARSTFSNYESARKAFWEDTLTPQYKRFADEMNSDLASEFDDAVILEWDFSKVPAMQEDLGNKWKRGVEGVKAGILTLNMFYEMVGLDKIENGDVFLRPSNVVPIKLENVADAPKPPAPPKLPALPKPKPEPMGVGNGNGNGNPNGKKDYVDMAGRPA